MKQLGKNFRLMFDGVINHVSSQSEWFQKFLRDDPRYRDYFITVEGSPDLSGVARPRVLPLLTQVHTPSGTKSVWTTFSDDQIDLNYRNPEVLLEIIDLILFYVTRGAEFIRLDAIAYLWKEIGTSCIHLPQTHHLIQLLRAVLDDVPLTFYSSPKPTCLIMTTCLTSAMDITRRNWFITLPCRRSSCIRFTPAMPRLSRNGRVISNCLLITQPSLTSSLHTMASALTRCVIFCPKMILKRSSNGRSNHGGLVSYKHNPDGSHSPYELNINYFDALSDPHENEVVDTQVDRFMAAQAIMLSLAGVPGIYFHSLFGSRGWLEGVKETGRNRTINRQKCDRGDVGGGT